MSGDDGTEAGYRFGRFHLLPRRRALLCDGQRVKLARRPLSLLIVLVERHDRTVGRDEILDLAFPGVFVEPHIVAVYVSAMRKLLGTLAITTIPGIGYRFTAKLELQADEISAEPALEPLPVTTTTNLPASVLPLIGRGAELADLSEILTQNRFVTLAGPGGVGKTRLALELGRQAAPRFPDGVRLIDLAPLIDPSLVASAAASVLGVALREQVEPVEAIAAAIAKKRLLLIFDNCDYLVGPAAALISRLLATVPLLSVLVASQEILGLPVETIYRLDPLTLPPEPGSAEGDAGEIGDYGAVQLFVTRARSADRRFKLESRNARSVAALCRGLGGIPLALEMAAARLPLLGIEGVLARLDERLRLFGNRLRMGETRHRTLLATVEWSHGLLDPADQSLFRRLSIFRGSFSLEAAVAVAKEDGAETWEIVDALARLIDKSLVTAEVGDPPRYRLLETLRLYGLEKLEESGETEGLAARHCRYLADLFEAADNIWETTPDWKWREVYGPLLDDIRAALDWSLARPKPAHDAITLAGAARLWPMMGLAPEGRRYVDRLIQRIDPETPSASAARLRYYAALRCREVDRGRSLALLHRSAMIYRELGDRLKLAVVLCEIGGGYVYLGRSLEAKVALEESLEILSGTDHLKSLSEVTGQLGSLAHLMGDVGEARRCLGASIDFAQALKDPVREAIALLNLGEVEFLAGSIGRAIERAEASARSLRAVGQPTYLGYALVNLTSYLLLGGSPAEARVQAVEALSLTRVVGGRWLRLCLQNWALLAARDGKFIEAAHLIGFVDADYARSGEIRQFLEQEIYDRLAPLLAAQLPAADIDALAAAGAGWSEDRAVEFTERCIVSTDRISA